jgi:hypothetical protein
MCNRKAGLMDSALICLLSVKCTSRWLDTRRHFLCEACSLRVELVARVLSELLFHVLRIAVCHSNFLTRTVQKAPLNKLLTYITCILSYTNRYARSLVMHHLRRSVSLLLTAQTRVRAQSNICRICGRQNNTGTGFSQSPSIFLS